MSQAGSCQVGDAGVPSTSGYQERLKDSGALWPVASASGEVLLADALCRFCYGEEGEDLISPCRCRGTQKFIHRSCLDSWRAARGWFALTHCSTCKAPFHLRLPEATPSRFLFTATLRSFVAALVFAVLQLVPLGLGYLSTRDTLHHSLHSLCSQSRLLCYCAGVWELSADVLFAMGLGLDMWWHRWAICVLVVCIKYSLVMPAAAHLVSFCQHYAYLLPPAFPPVLLPPPLHATTPALLPHHAALNTILGEHAALVGCSAHVLGVVSSVTLGFAISACIVFQVLLAMGPLAKGSRSALVQELEVLDVKGDYSPPCFSKSQMRRLNALSVLA